MAINQQSSVGFVMPPQPPNQYQHAHGNQYYPNPHQNIQPLQQAHIQQAYQPFQYDWMTTNFQSYLANATSLRVKQKIDMIESFVGWEQGNKYSVSDQAGNKMFHAFEQSDCLARQVCDSLRPFTVYLKDTSGKEILNFERPLRCTQIGCCLCLPQELRIRTPDGRLLGTVLQNCAIFASKFTIKDATGKSVLKIHGPWLPCAFRCQGITFELRSLNGSRIGAISKEFGGIVREMFTDADTFGITFPIDLSPDIKAVCLGALFLIDFMYFEQK